jgi:indolepyruvate ferredoxin oxidoreductase beta subunit
MLARWIGESALAEGYDVCIAEVHGMNQRGGSVEAHVRFRKEVYAP